MVGLLTAQVSSNPMTNPGNSVLVVDDEPDIRSSMTRILRLDGYRVDTASSIGSALDRENWSDYFAILMDRKLPDGMGDDLLPQLRQLAPHAACIVITAHADLESSLNTLRYGAEDYLLKPIDPEAVRHRLHRILEVRRAEERARQAERLAVIGQMMTALSHESRNFLQRIQSAVELARLDAEDRPQLMRELDKIERASDGLRALLEEVRNHAAPIKLERIPTCTRQLWRRSWAELESTRQRRDAQLEELWDGIDTTCKVDAFRMQQVFRNLFENSLAACGDPVIVRIECQDGMLGAKHALLIHVSDNGPGLPPEVREKVFEPFYTTKSQGTGLGLAIVQRIVEAHDGRISVGDPPGTGACFTIALPR